MKRLWMVLAVAAIVVLLLPMVLVLGVIAVWPDPHERHFDFPLPASAELVNYHQHRAGFDRSYAFEYAVTDDQLMNTIVRRYGLQELTDPTRELKTFIMLRPPAWQPANLDAIAEERYAKWVNSQEKYGALWFDRDTKRLYFHYGNW